MPEEQQDSAELDEIGYADALAELEEILEELEGDAVDIDLLSSRVERAAALIGVCRGRIHRAQAQVSRVMESFDSLTESAADTDDG